MSPSCGFNPIKDVSSLAQFCKPLYYVEVDTSTGCLRRRAFLSDNFHLNGTNVQGFGEMLVFPMTGDVILS